MASPSELEQAEKPWFEEVFQKGQSSSSATGPSGDAGRPTPILQGRDFDGMDIPSNSSAVLSSNYANSPTAQVGSAAGAKRPSPILQGRDFDGMDIPSNSSAVLSSNYSNRPTAQVGSAAGARRPSPILQGRDFDGMDIPSNSSAVLSSNYSNRPTAQVGSAAGARRPSPILQGRDFDGMDIPSNSSAVLSSNYSNRPTAQVGSAAGARGPQTKTSDIPGSPSYQETEPRGMPYSKNAMPPETREEHSIYPMGPTIPRRAEFTDTAYKPKSGFEEWSLQENVKKNLEGLFAKKWNQTAAPTGPVAATPELVRLDRYGRERQEREGGPVSRRKVSETLGFPHETMDRNQEAGPDSDRGFIVFEDTPRDSSIVWAKEWILQHAKSYELIQASSLSALSEMPDWDPDLDTDFQNEATESLNKWCDYRFRVPKTPADRASVQQALELTRMDFWLRNPNKTYPTHLEQHPTESYGSQHRRLQHAFCRTWRGFSGGPAPALYRLPAWMFGFETRNWKPANWGTDGESEAYARGLVRMADQRYGEGLRGMDYRYWRAMLHGRDEGDRVEAAADGFADPSSRPAARDETR